MTSKNSVSILDRPLGKPKGELNISTFAFLLSEMVQYSKKRVYTAEEFQKKLADFGRHVGVRLLDLVFLREKKDKREIKLLDQLNFIKKQIWKTIYFKELDRIEKHETDPLIYYIVELEPVVNRFFPRKGNDNYYDYNLAYFNLGIIDAILNESNFSCKVEIVYSDFTTYYQITFNKSIESKQ